MRVRRLLKVYNHINDERRRNLNVKFVSGLALMLVSGIAIAGFILAGDDSSPTADGNLANQAPEDDLVTEYVGLDMDEIMVGEIDPDLVRALRDQWERDHAGAVIHHDEPVRFEGVVVGYRITYVGP